MNYSIKELEGITNLKAHTIRIWELRYDILTPKRTPSNIRIYDDEDLKKLLNVCALLVVGMKISKISQLNDLELKTEIDKIISSETLQNEQLETFINQIIIAISEFDEIYFNKIFNTAIAKLGLKDTYLLIIYPLMVRIGLMWTKGDIMPAQEHFLSNIIKQKLFAAIDAFPINKSYNQTWLLFLPEKEDHELGLLMANFILRQQGKKVIYLGQKVPTDNILQTIKSCKPTHTFTFFVVKKSQEFANNLINQILKIDTKLIFCVSGKQIIDNQFLTNKKLKVITDINSLIEVAEN